MLEIKGYITNLGKYNEGKLIGEWITFPIDDEELNEVFKRIGLNHYNEDMDDVITGYEEYFFTDWDCDFDNNFGEYESIDKINELAEKLQEWDEDTFKAACEIWNIKDLLEDDLTDYILMPDIKNDYDLGYYWIEESGYYEYIPDDIRQYIDYEAFGKDIRINDDGGHTEYGYIYK